MKYPFLSQIEAIFDSNETRQVKAEHIAEAIRSAQDYRWVGIYDVNDQEVAVIAWSGPSAPAFPRFPVSLGLNGAAVASRSTVISNDVTQDARYLTALGSTQAEMVTPVKDPSTGVVVGTIDVESVHKNAFSDADRSLIEAFAQAILPLWF